MSRSISQVFRQLAVVVLALVLLPQSANALVGSTTRSAAAADWPVPAAPVTLRIDTEGAAPVTSKDDYVEGSMVLEGVTHPLEIKGRGNSTWRWPKKPYKLKLGTEAGLLGMPAHDEWVLLANYADRSSLRTHLAFGLAASTRLAWTPRTRFVDLVLNGQSQGLYVLTDQVEVGEDRVALDDDAFLLEVDERFRASGDPGFRTSRGTPISFKDPDELTGKQRRRVKGAVAGLEDALYGKHFTDPRKGYAAHIDVDSVIDWYLVEEFFRNQDSTFYSSVYVSWDPDTGFAMGPVWDFDLSAGTKWNTQTAPQGWHTRVGRHWIARMFQDPSFSARVKARWAELRPVVDAMVAQVDAAADVIRPSALASWPLWPPSGGEVAGSVHADSFDGEVAFLRDWLAARAQWMSSNEVIFDRLPRTVREDRAVVHVPVRLLGTSGSPVTVRYSVTGGTATPGEDFTLPGGNLTFQPGETTADIAIRLTDDGLAEGPETLDLVLDQPTGGTILGSPSGLQLTIGSSDLRPDLEVRRAGPGGWAGGDVWNRSGRGQRATDAARAGRSARFVVRVGNDSDAQGRFAVRGTRATTVRYRSGGRDVTRAMRSKSGWKVQLAPGARKPVTVVVTVPRGAAAGSRQVARVKAHWTGDRKQVDVVRAAVRVRR